MEKDLVKEIYKMAKDRVTSKVREENATDNLNTFERQLRNEESKRNRLIGTLLKYQEFFPERAHRILSLEIIESMENESIELISNSYNVTELDKLRAIGIL